VKIAYHFVCIKIVLNASQTLYIHISSLNCLFILFASFWGRDLNLEFELRALCLQGRCSITATTSPDFCLDYFEDRVLLFCPGQPGLRSFYFKLPIALGMIGTHHNTHLLCVKMQSHKHFFWGCLGTTILPSS
jgi:hypothetical protein